MRQTADHPGDRPAPYVSFVLAGLSVGGKDMTPNESRPAGNEAAPTAEDAGQYSCRTGKCAFGAVCTCDYYAEWMTWPAAHSEAVSVQLRRRRLASYRCTPLPSGRRDPISRSVG
jgi:hypothetical protein